MERPWRPASEHFESGGSHVRSSSETWREEDEEEEEEERAPIFSLSKSSMDVLMAAGPPHKRDPAWTRLDLRRSSSTSARPEQNSLTLQQLRACAWQRANPTNSHQAPQTPQHGHIGSPPSHSERWVTNVERWSVCSGSAHSGSSTPETVVWRGGTKHPWNLTQEAPCSSAPDSPTSKLPSPPTSPPPFISPLQTAPVSPADTDLPSPLTLPPYPNQQEDTHMPHVSSSTPSPLPSPPQAHTPSPLPPSPLPPNSPVLPQLTGTEDECFLQKHILFFPLPSLSPTPPSPSSVSLEEGGGFESVSPEPGGFVDGAVERPPSLTFNPGSTQSLGDGVGSPRDVFMPQSPNPQAQGQESREVPPVCHLELPWQPGQSGPTGSSPCRGWRSPLVSSLSDPRLDNCCRCNSTQSGLEIMTLMASPRAAKGRAFGGNMTLEEGTMTSQLTLVDVAVQTVSPPGSWWNLRRNMSYMSYSYMSSHSVLGSPPGSRLNLRSSLGSNSNLVSPSSSMFPLDSGDDEEGQGDSPVWEVSSPLLHPRERRRSCLKAQGDERLSRRSSMKQVQWDEDGMTWDVYGASLDLQELSTAIQRHLEQSGKDRESPRPQKKKSKKKTASKVAEIPLTATIVKVGGPKPTSPVMVDTATSMREKESEARPEAEGDRELETEGCTKGEIAEDVCRNAKAEGEIEIEDGEGEKEEVYGDEDTLHRKSLSRASGRSLKKGVLRSLKRPGWCGSSSKADK